MSKTIDVVALDRGELASDQDHGTGLAPLLAHVFADVSGGRLFDDGCDLPARTLLTIGPVQAGSRRCASW